MKYKDFIVRFNKQVFKLGFDKQLAFAITICKKLYFDYLKFYETYNWGEPDILLDAISIAESNQVDEFLIETQINLLSSVTPDMDDFGDEVSSYALNACVAIYETLRFLQDKEPKHIFDVGTCLTDTIDFRVQEENNLSEDEIDNHPLMIEARNYLLQQSKKSGFSLKSLFNFK